MSHPSAYETGGMCAGHVNEDGWCVVCGYQTVGKREPEPAPRPADPVLDWLEGWLDPFRDLLDVSRVRALEFLIARRRAELEEQ